MCVWEAIKPELMEEAHCTVRLPAKYAQTNKMCIVSNISCLSCDLK